VTHHVPARPRLVPYDPSWPTIFADEARVLKAALAPVDPQIEHVGSTAVAGLPAKPVIDILVGVTGYEQFEGIRAVLADLGYAWDADAERDDPGRRVFRKGSVDAALLRTHHLHLTIVDGPYWRRLLAFRDRLRRDPAAARRYAQVKFALVQSCGGDSRGYTRGKSTIVRSIEEEAGFTG
jgi:GrpB-like predicted nucleotidyltransferase (UPF0157 family)